MGVGEAILVSGLTKRFGELLAVDHIGFQVMEGDFFGFLGPNGAGKTTTIRMLTGVIKSDEGVVSIMGYNIQREPVKAKQVMGIVPEMANAYVDLTAWQNLMFLGKLYGLSKRDRYECGEDLLKRFGLYERRDQRVKTFSKGMKQRLIICAALLNNPKILFLDEPTVGLDVQSTLMIRDILRDLNERGTTVFLTTHNIEEANLLCNKIAVISHGRIATINSPEKLRGAFRGTQSLEVAFDGSVDVSSLSKLPGVNEARKLGDKIRLYTDKPGDLVCHVVDYARSNNLKLITLNVLAPSLEDAFIRLTKGDGRGVD